MASTTLDLSNLQPGNSPYTEFSNSAAIVDEGGDTVLRLTTDEVDADSAGSAFTTSQISIQNDASFETQFTFQTSQAGEPDGFTFILHNDPNGVNALGDGAPGLGYQDFDFRRAEGSEVRQIVNAIVIEFDTFTNNETDATSQYYKDIGEQREEGNSIEVALVDSNGDRILLDANDQPITQADLQTSLPDLDFNDSTPYTAWVQYDGTTQLLSIFVAAGDAPTKPTTAALTVDLSGPSNNLETVLGGQQAYVGFTASSSATAPVSHDITAFNFELTTANVPPSLTGTPSGISYTEGDPAVNVGIADLVVSDENADEIASAEISIVGAEATESLSVGIDLPDGLTSTFADGTLRISGFAPTSTYANLLRNITYFNSDDTPPATRSISFSVNDGEFDSNALIQNITITDIEEPPVEEPPIEEPPVEEPPVEQPPVEQPPVEQPPVEQPPVEQPPVEQPPAEQPPVVDTPGGDTPIPAAPTFSLFNTSTNLLGLEGTGESKLAQFNLLEKSLKGRFEVGFYKVDDDQGTIDGVDPSSANYISKVIENTTTLFATLGDGDILVDSTRLLSLNAGHRYGFYVLPNNTLDSLAAGGTGDLKLGLLSAGSSSPLSYTFSPEAEAYILNWDLDEDKEFDDLSLEVKLTDDSGTILGASLQGGFESELLDLRSLPGAVQLTFDVSREAKYDNLIGFYEIEDVQGTIQDEFGNLLRPGDAGYTQAAVQQWANQPGITGRNGSTVTTTVTVDGGGILAPFIIVDGTVGAILDGDPANDPAVYFPFLGANSDGADHIKLLGDNLFGFEDLPGGGDLDFDDMVVRTTVQPITA